MGCHAASRRRVRRRGPSTRWPVAFFRPLDDTTSTPRARRMSRATRRSPSSSSRASAIPCCPGRTLVSDARGARTFAAELGYPVMVKANAGAGGEGIERATRTRSSTPWSCAHSPSAMSCCSSRTSRACAITASLVLDGELLLAYERIPLTIEGDGRSTIRELVDARQRTGRRSTSIASAARGPTCCAKASRCACSTSRTSARAAWPPRSPRSEWLQPARHRDLGADQQPQRQRSGSEGLPPRRHQRSVEPPALQRAGRGDLRSVPVEQLRR